MQDIIDYGLWLPLYPIYESDWIAILKERVKDRINWFSDVRDPKVYLDNSQMKWHADCGGRPQRLIIWSNETPTEVRRIETKERIFLANGHIYSIKNVAFEHRTSPTAYAQGTNRWFTRAYIYL